MKKKKLKKYRKRVYSLRWSPEIEVEFDEKVDIEVLYNRYRRILGNWTVTHDYSLQNGLEFKPKRDNKLYYNTESFAEIGEILHIIRKHKGKIKPKTCGLHIHIDTSKFSDKEVLMVVREFIQKQRYICDEWKVKQCRIEDMCKLIPKKYKTKLKETHIYNLRHRYQEEGFDYEDYLSNKHHTLNVLNLAKFNSLEFRLFNGSLKVREMKLMVKYLFEFLINALERE